MRETKRLTKEELDHFREAVNSPLNPVKYLGIDPGKHNGVCGYDAKFYLQFMKPVNSNDMVIFLEQFSMVDVCVIEDYKLYPNKAKVQTYSDMETSRVIGRVESWSHHKGVKLVKQKALIKKTGYAWLGQKPLPKSDPMNDPLDAHVHFMYWAVLTGRIKAEELLKRPLSGN